MSRNYMTYPMKYMRITQNYLGGTSHLKHTTGYPKDYPIDEAGKDTGRDDIYCPCDEMMITAIKGYGNVKVTNTIWLVSTGKVVTPTFEDVVFMTLTHENDSDLKKLKVGQKFKRGEVICHEGTNGATANHIHIVCGRGSSKNWEKNTTGAWVISGDTKKPEEVFFIDRSFTTVLSNGGLAFQNLEVEKVGTPSVRNSAVNQLEVVVSNLNARVSPSITASSLGYVNPGIYEYSSFQEADGYTWYKIADFWIAYQPSWMHLYPKEIHAPIEKLEDKQEAPVEEVKEEIEKPPVDDVTDTSEKSFDGRLIFTAKESKYYKIFLKENAKLYLKDS